MVMEIGSARQSEYGRAGLGATRWTSNSARPFSRAPGAGGGLRGLKGFETGFAADPVNEEPAITVVGQGPFTVTQQPALAGEIPSLFIQFVYTDRGLLNKERLDASVRDLLQRSGFRTSKATDFKPVAATWRLVHEPQADFYFPVIATPAQFAGLRYSGNALVLPLHSNDASALGKLPPSVYVYSLAATSNSNTMTDADAARALTLLRQAMTTMANGGMNAYAHVNIVRRSSPADVFGDGGLGPVAKLGISSLILVVAANMLSSHIGSERL